MKKDLEDLDKGFVQNDEPDEWLINKKMLFLVMRGSRVKIYLKKSKNSAVHIPMRGTESDVAGIISATSSIKTVRDSRTVIPAGKHRDTGGFLILQLHFVSQSILDLGFLVCSVF